MLHLYTWNTPNGIKPIVMLEECGLDYELHPIDISADEQKTDAFLTVNPNGRIPAMIDTDHAGTGRIGEASGLRVFESGAILMHLAALTNRFLPTEPQALADAMSWTFWQVGGLGPMVGQAHWFASNAPDNEQGLARYRKETARLLGVMELGLSDRDYLAGEYGVADMMNWKWAVAGLDAVDGDWPRLADWVRRVGERPAVRRAVEAAEAIG